MIGCWRRAAFLVSAALAITSPAAAQPATASWEQVAWWATLGATLLALVVVAEIVWTRSLARQVRARTAALERSEAQYRQLVENASDLIYRTDADGRFTFANPVMLRVTEYQSDELIGMSYLDLVDPAWREKVLAFYRTPETGSGSYLEFPIRTKSGRQVWVGQHVQTVRTRKRLEGFQGVARDITERVEIERLRSQFVSMVSHELRTPLTSIRASLQLLQEPDAAPDDAERLQLLNTSLANTQRLIRIVNDILDMSKIDAGQMVIEQRPSSVGTIVDEAIRTVEPWAQRLGVALDVRIGPELPLIAVDHGRTVQAIINLLSNAIKHAPEASAVEVSAERHDRGVAVSVCDHGPGIPPERVDEIFKPFTQLDASDTRKIPGTGLGLTIAKALVERQGGSISVGSQAGKGARFTVVLPMASSDGAVAEAPTRTANGSSPASR